MQIFVESDENRQIARRFIYPDSTATGLLEPQTVFLAKGYEIPEGKIELADVDYVYSDQLVFMSFDIHEQGMILAHNSELVENSAAFFEVYLRHVLHNSTIKLVHIMVGLNNYSLNSYRIFGFVKSEEKESK